IKKSWSGPIGFHGHDNMGRGLSNTFCAVARGVTWVDATLTGMGRGAGNTQMEYLIAGLSRKGHSELHAAPVIGVAARTFEPLKHMYGWGSNIFYYLGAIHGVHPSYVQDLLSSGDNFSP